MNYTKNHQISIINYVSVSISTDCKFSIVLSFPIKYLFIISLLKHLFWHYLLYFVLITNQDILNIYWIFDSDLRLITTRFRAHSIYDIAGKQGRQTPMSKTDFVWWNQKVHENIHMHKHQWGYRVKVVHKITKSSGIISKNYNLHANFFKLSKKLECHYIVQKILCSNILLHGNH